MDWSNEQYVRVYTRDTATWKLLDWEARSVLCLIFRKVDRSGVLEVGDEGLDGLAAVIEVPTDVAKRAVDQLLKRGVLVAKPNAFVLPKFLEAQESSKSDRVRQRESRERRRAITIAGHEVSQPVTTGHAEPVDVTPGHDQSRDVTTSHDASQESQNVTLCFAELTSTDPPPDRPLARAPRAPARNGRSGRAKCQTEIPDDWAPNEKARVRAAELDLNVDDEAERFRNDAQKKGQRWSDWDAAFRNWLLLAPKFRAGYQRAGPSRAAPPLDVFTAQLGRIAMLEAEEAAEAAGKRGKS